MTSPNLLAIVENAATEEEALLMAGERLLDYYEKLRYPPYFAGELSPEQLTFSLRGQENASVKPHEVPFLFANVNYENLQRIKKLYGSKIRIQGGKYVSYSTRNPNAKWFHCGFSKDLDGILPSISLGKSVNALRKEDADFSNSKQLALEEAQATYDKYESLTKSLDPGSTFEELCRKYYDAENQNANLERVRYEYRNSEWAKVIQNSFNLEPYKAHEYFCVRTGGRQAFLDKTMNSHLTLPNLLDDNNNWFEKVQVGIFPDYKIMEASKWHKLFWGKIAEASTHAWLVAFDIKI